MVVGLQMLVGAVPLTIASALTETLHVNVTAGLITAFIYTTLAPGLLATWIWFKLVARIGATRAATFHFLNPFFGVAIAAIVLGEGLSQYDIIGVIVDYGRNSCGTVITPSGPLIIKNIQQYSFGDLNVLIRS